MPQKKSDVNVRGRPEAILSALAAVLPAAQEDLDRSWIAEVGKTQAALGGLNLQGVPSLAAAVMPPRFVFTRQTLRMTCHTSIREESGARIGASVLLIPLPVGMAVRHRRAFDCACRLELTVERLPIDFDPLR